MKCHYNDYTSSASTSSTSFVTQSVKYPILKTQLMLLQGIMLLVFDLVFKSFKSNIATENALNSLTCSQIC